MAQNNEAGSSKRTENRNDTESPEGCEQETNAEVSPTNPSKDDDNSSDSSMEYVPDEEEFSRETSVTNIDNGGRQSRRSNPNELAGDLSLTHDEMTQSINLQRELRKLRFENPGSQLSKHFITDTANIKAVISGEVNQVEEHSFRRPKRKVAAKTTNYKDGKYKPHHDRHGNFIGPKGEAVNLCDCLDKECPGCHRPCKKCGTQKCSFQCRSNRSAVIEYVECNIQGRVKFTYNPFIEDFSHE